MPCDTYKNALTEAAATGAEPQNKLRVHLDRCAPCRAFFAAEQSLFAVIDSSMRRAVNEEMPSSVLPRLRVRLEEEAAPKRRWILVPAALTAAATLMVASFVERTGRHGAEPQRETPTQVASKISPSEIVAAQREHATKSSGLPAIRASRRGNIAARPEASLAEPQVLVPAGQEKAVALLIASLRSGEVKAEGLLAGGRNREPQDMQVSPLILSPLELEPLEDVHEGRR